MAPDAGRAEVAVVLPVGDCKPPVCGAVVALMTGKLSVPVRNVLCTIVIGVLCTMRLAGDRPVAITVTRNWSPRPSS